MKDLLKKIDEYIYLMYKKINIYEYITPLNLKEENTKFLKAFEEGRIYNPVYKYKELDVNYNEILNKLNEYKVILSEKNFINTKMHRYIEELEENINLCINIGNNSNLIEYSKTIYGEPNEILLKKALNILEHDTVMNDITECKYSSDDCVNIFKKILDRLNLNQWRITIKENQSSKISVFPEKKEININKYAKFSKNDMKRLIVHEIGTHVLRGENGSNQPYKIFSICLEQTLETEEGLATVNEDSFNILDERTLRIYAGRVIAVYESKNKSFYEIYKKLLKYFCSEDALYITSRVKRGMGDTSKKGGFTKDYVYLKGYYQIKEYCEKYNKDDLYIGILGYNEVNECISYVEQGQLNKPQNTFSEFIDVFRNYDLQF